MLLVLPSAQIHPDFSKLDDVGTFSNISDLNKTIVTVKYNNINLRKRWNVYINWRVFLSTPFRHRTMQPTFVCDQNKTTYDVHNAGMMHTFLPTLSVVPIYTKSWPLWLCKKNIYIPHINKLCLRPTNQIKFLCFLLPKLFYVLLQSSCICTYNFFLHC